MFFQFNHPMTESRRKPDFKFLSILEWFPLRIKLEIEKIGAMLVLKIQGFGFIWKYRPKIFQTYLCTFPIEQSSDKHLNSMIHQQSVSIYLAVINMLIHMGMKQDKVQCLYLE